MNKPKFILPNFVRLRYVFNTLDNIRRESPEIFEDYELFAVHGALNELYWHEKTRLSGNTRPGQHGIRFQYERKIFNTRKYSIFLDFSNPLLDEYDCLDRYGNKALMSFENELNVIVLSAESLFSYVKEQYPQYKICWKFFGEVSASDIEAKLKSCDFVLLPTTSAYDNSFLQNIPPELRAQCIFSVNDMCSVICPNFNEHMKKSSEIACSMRNENAPDFCPIFYGRMTHSGNNTTVKRLANKQIMDELHPIGYNLFYIDSSQLYLNHFLQEIVKTIVKEEYQLDVLNILCDSIRVMDELYIHSYRNS